jgi:hypothetical protein
MYVAFLLAPWHSRRTGTQGVPVRQCASTSERLLMTTGDRASNLIAVDTRKVQISVVIVARALEDGVFPGLNSRGAART